MDILKPPKVKYLIDDYKLFFLKKSFLHFSEDYILISISQFEFLD